MPARHVTNGLAQVPGNEAGLDATVSPQTPPAELWEAWRMAQAGSELALNTWYAASKGQRARAYAAYTAALDLEGRAAEALAQAGAAEAAVAA
jgi:hypothetical protein